MLMLALLFGECLLAGDPPAGRIVVDRNGGGDFRTITEALNSLDSTSQDAHTIFIRDGIYPEKIFISKSDVTLEGESRERTIITQSIARDIWRCNDSTDWGAATVNIAANDISLKNLTIQNTYGFDHKQDQVVHCAGSAENSEKSIRRDGHQMALRTFAGTRIKAINVHFKAFGGDTVSPWDVTNGMYYFRDCIMEGGVDFYCPRGWAFAENCRFIAHTGTAAIWHDGSAHEDSKTVLKNCSFEGFDGFNLGRYHRDAQFYLINCSFAANMADRDIYLVPTDNTIQWGKRIYYFNCHKAGGDYDWFKDNLLTAKGAPSAERIDAAWTFNGRWQPEKMASATFILENPSSFTRKDELIVLRRKDVEEHLGSIPDGRFLVVTSPSPRAIQLDDMDGDGKWDEAVFLKSFAAKEKTKFNIAVSDRPAAVKIPVRSYAQLSKKQPDESYSPPLQKEIMPYNAAANDFTVQPIPLYRSEGPTWENDLVGFRLYFDNRNVKDIFGKVTSGMVLDTVGSSGDRFYHQFDPAWGMDILKVGKSLGAGGIAVLKKVNGKDSLFKPAGTNTKHVSYELIANGPVRSVFRLKYKDWQVADTSYDVTEEISIWGGQYFYESRITTHPAAQMVTGIVSLHSKKEHHFISNKMAVLYSLDKQSENDDQLGMALIAPARQTAAFRKIPAGTTGVTDTYSMIFQNQEQQIFRFYAGWEKTDARFSRKKYFNKFLITESEKWQRPIAIHRVD